MNAVFTMPALALTLPEAVLHAVGLTAVLATLAGLWLQWHRHAHLSDIEEALKDGKLAPDEARERTRLVASRPPLLLATGLLLMIAVASGWLG